jgi:hypothetical protein
VMINKESDFPADDNRHDNGGNESAPSHADTKSASVAAAKSNVENNEKKKSRPAEDCVICVDAISSPKRLPCGHVFCSDCIDEYFRKCQPKCPSCGKVYGALRGNQPPGTFTVRTSSLSLTGYEKFGSIEIQYYFPDGIQTV